MTDAWQFAAASAIGGRSEQQDRVAVLTDADSGTLIAVVAVGLGGHAGGAAAAQAVVDTVAEHWSASLKPATDPEALLRTICLAAHDRISGLDGVDGHSTCALLYADATAAVLLHVGDSRIYRFRGAEAFDRTSDHSLVQLLLDRGEIAEEDMASHPDQNRLLQALGGERDPRPDVTRSDAASFDAFVLCSDGLWEAVSHDEMGAALSAEDLEAAARQLADTAAERRGERSDNVAVALVRRRGPTGGSPECRAAPSDRADGPADGRPAWGWENLWQTGRRGEPLPANHGRNGGPEAGMPRWGRGPFTLG
jgi:serine/threonine protein phosphatase PrpC